MNVTLPVYSSEACQAMNMSLTDWPTYSGNSAENIAKSKL